ncbi:phospholipase A2-like [Ischnura elegans]|uniref:phospholipase A2-like n=1 Tax=Ischnura elegans TaxID=197161 RepID=UPI001ED86C3B|nr:phospholipase A2-like [Ischnura elegans]XP_046384816.1 phospholipase A2-like [Ischnura elegans]
MNVLVGLLIVAQLGQVYSMEETLIVQADQQMILRVMDSYPEENEDSVNSQSRQIIFPGTKWCGDGNISMHEEDYGYFEESDRCCKDHDYCPDFIAGGEMKYGLHNDAFYTRLHCDCDQQFYDCLKKTNFIVSDEIGFTYFNAIGTKCYRKDFPIVRCFKYSTVIKRRCRVYELDQTKSPIWQWFDLPIY